ncbi:MAG: hypothetical protein HY840_13920 [Bacteroidetes bacterium]|nr:hypothetical protein [Bacteroidota bacterium]
MENINRLLKPVVTVVLTIAVILTIYTYYAYLNQYPTADQQQFSLARFNDFRKDFRQINFSEGSNLSFILVTLPGSVLDRLLKSDHLPGDKLFGNISYNEVYAFTFFQVTFSLLFLLYAGLLLGKALQLKLKQDGWLYLFMLLLIMNYPILKGDIKVLKYDAFSILCSFIAVLHYILYKQCKRKISFILSILFCALAFIEKDTTIITFFSILFVELIYVSLLSVPLKEAIRRYLKFLLISILIFFITTAALVPQFWFNPGKLTEVFISLPFQAKAMDLKNVMIILFLAILYFLGSRLIVLQPEVTYSCLKKINFRLVLLVCGFAFLLIFISAVLYQTNNMYGMHYADMALKQKVSDGACYATPELANLSISTLDSSSLLTRVKICYNIFRVIAYSVPELISILFFLSPFILLLGVKYKLYENTTLLKYFIAFPLLLFLSYFIFQPPINFKYLIPVVLLIIAFIFYIMIRFFTGENPFYKYRFVIIILFSALLIRPAVVSFPHYLCHMSIFRNTNLENSDYLDMNIYSEWTWVGWGETAGACFKYIEDHSKGEVKVLHDYVLPFSFSKRIKPHFSVQGRNRYLAFLKKDLKEMLKQLRDADIEYILISKNVAYRGSISNYIMNRYRRNAVFADKVGGIEYGWVFKTADISKAVEQTFPE